MSDNQWETFFDIMDKIINQPGMTANEKIKDFRTHAEYNSADLEEFLSYVDVNE